MFYIYKNEGLEESTGDQVSAQSKGASDLAQHSVAIHAVDLRLASNCTFFRSCGLYEIHDLYNI